MVCFIVDMNRVQGWAVTCMVIKFREVLESFGHLSDY
jgi:hypothetical protein